LVFINLNKLRTYALTGEKYMFLNKNNLLKIDYLESKALALGDQPKLKLWTPTIK